jgi:hypothetical protein
MMMANGYPADAINYMINGDMNTSHVDVPMINGERDIDHNVLRIGDIPAFVDYNIFPSEMLQLIGDPFRGLTNCRFRDTPSDRMNPNYYIPLEAYLRILRSLDKAKHSPAISRLSKPAGCVSIIPPWIQTEPP